MRPYRSRNLHIIFGEIFFLFGLTMLLYYPMNLAIPDTTKAKLISIQVWKGMGWAVWGMFTMCYLVMCLPESNTIVEDEGAKGKKPGDEEERLPLWMKTKVKK